MIRKAFCILQLTRKRWLYRYAAAVCSSGESTYRQRDMRDAPKGNHIIYLRKIVSRLYPQKYRNLLYKPPEIRYNDHGGKEAT